MRSERVERVEVIFLEGIGEIYSRGGENKIIRFFFFEILTLYDYLLTRFFCAERIIFHVFIEYNFIFINI